MATRDETIDLSPFVLGNAYTRVEIASAGGVHVPESIFETVWSEGIVPFANAVLLFVSLEKEKYTYRDFFEGDIFWWQSQKRQSRKTKLIADMEAGVKPAYLFARLRPKDKTTCPFVYCGRLSAPVLENDKPVDCLFHLLDYVQGATGSLAELYAWRPGAAHVSESHRQEMVRRRGGQGFQVDTALRRELELYAMARAKAHYENAGYSVENTSASRPYDLVCTRGSEFRRVEVKGTSTAGERVILTSGEVLAARERGVTTDLFVVREIKVTRTDVTRELSGGVVHLIENWVPHDDHLEAKQYSYQVPAVA